MCDLFNVVVLLQHEISELLLLQRSLGTTYFLSIKLRLQTQYIIVWTFDVLLLKAVLEGKLSILFEFVRQFVHARMQKFNRSFVSLNI